MGIVFRTPQNSSYRIHVSFGLARNTDGSSQSAFHVSHGRNSFEGQHVGMYMALIARLTMLT